MENYRNCGKIREIIKIFGRYLIIQIGLPTLKIAQWRRLVDVLFVINLIPFQFKVIQFDTLD